MTPALRADAFSDADLDRLVLERIAPGPVRMLDVVADLGLNEKRVHEAFRRLRDTGDIRPRPGPAHRRTWVVRGYQPAFNAPVKGQRPPWDIKPKAAAPTTSWWAQHAAPEAPRAQFVDALTTRDREMQTSRQWNSLGSRRATE